MVNNSDRVTRLEMNLAKLCRDLKDDREASSQWFHQAMKAMTDLSVKLRVKIGSLSNKEEENIPGDSNQDPSTLMRKARHPGKRRVTTRKKKKIETRANMEVISNMPTFRRSRCPYSIGKTLMVGSTEWNAPMRSKVLKARNNSRQPPYAWRD